MELEIKKLAAFDCDLRNWKPDAPGAWLDVTVGVGVAGEDGLNWFNVTVASEEAAALRGEVGSRKGLLVCREVTGGESVREALQHVVRSCTAPSWKESVQLLCRFFDWEYEDYQDAG